MKKQVLLLFLFSLLLVSFASGAIRYYEPYYGGYGFGSFSNYFDRFLDFIEQNEFVVDAIVFLVIFLIIAKKVFSDFSKDKALYVVIGIALTIGIMMYERETNYSLIIHSGWLSMVVLAGLVVYVLSRAELTSFRLITIGGVGVVALSWGIAEYYDKVFYVIPPFIVPILWFIFAAMIFIGIYKLVKGKEESEAQRLARLARGRG